MTEVIPVIIGGGFQVKALKICARAERKSQYRQNEYSHHLGVRAEQLHAIGTGSREDPHQQISAEKQPTCNTLRDSDKSIRLELSRTTPSAFGRPVRLEDDYKPDCRARSNRDRHRRKFRLCTGRPRPEARD